MNMKQNTDPSQYRMNFYPGGVAAPAGYTVAVANKPGLYAASPYAPLPSPYASGQPGLSPSMQHFAAVRQQYAVVSQPSAYPSSQHAAAAASYFTSPAMAGYAAPSALPLSSMQPLSSPSPQSPYLGAQYAPVQAAMLRPATAAASYGGSPLYAYSGVPTLPAQPSRAPYAVGPLGYAVGATSIPPSASSPAYPSANTFGVSPY